MPTPIEFDADVVVISAQQGGMQWIMGVETRGRYLKMKDSDLVLKTPDRLVFECETEAGVTVRLTKRRTEERGWELSCDPLLAPRCAARPVRHLALVPDASILQMRGDR